MGKISTEESYALSIEDVTNTIANTGTEITYLAEGHIGSGKSTILKMLMAMSRFKDTHVGCYFDCTTKDMGDFLIPNLQSIGDDGIVRFAPNSELGLQYKKPVILMFDELGKAVPPIRRAANRVALERKIGEHTLPKGSIVFATTNLGAENIGDMLEAHSRDRYTPIRMRKSGCDEWLENYAIPNRLNPAVMGFAKETPEIFNSFEVVKDPKDNPYIFHPADPQRNAQGFLTLRGLERASWIVDKKHTLSDVALTAALRGTIGVAGSKALFSYVNMLGSLPSVEDIEKNPLGAIVPDNNMAAQSMIVYRALGGQLARSWIDNWFAYLDRLHPAMQGLFMQSVVATKANGGPEDFKYPKVIRICTSNATFREWCQTHNYAFTADKK